jgi:GH15 family glucan-1,4-alpha-glucosidase
MLVTIRALLDGASFAKRLGDSKSAGEYEETVKEIEASLGRFWDKERQYLVSSVEVVNDHGKHTWLDTGAFTRRSLYILLVLG